MTKARFDPSQLPAGMTRPLYAGVGATDRVVEVVREAVADVQKRALAVQKDVQESVAGIDYQPQALRDTAVQVLSAQIDALGKDAQDRRRAMEQRVAALRSEAKTLPTRLQKLIDEQVAAYDELVKRGETLIGRISGQQSTQDAVASTKTTVAKARTTRTQATGTAQKSTAAAKKTAKRSPAKSSAKATRTSATRAAESGARAAKDAAEKIGD